MSPTTVGVASRRDSARRSAAARRRAAIRRRNRLIGGVLLGAVVLGVVLLMPLLQKTVNEFGLPLTNADVIRQQAAEKHLDPALIAAVIYAETKFDPRNSVAGARGLMQVMPQTAEFLARRSGATSFTVADLGTPQVNIAYGSYYLRYLLDEYHGSTTLALAAYNGGESNVDRWIADARAQGHTLTVNDIPFPETRAYVTRVLSAEGKYRHTYASQLYR
ncbi:MAG TPA: lytic transglycosylase domain-containing protein [Solirubrobacteraceae bacterium]|nr:lytic transglycosylase domain-containing protein [Solirubrobacteraceae bacterium]